MNLIRDLQGHSAQHFSQNGEDGVIEHLMERIGVTDRFYVEIGTGTGEECNTRYLREQGWSGVMFDCGHENAAIDLHKEFITAANVNSLMVKYHVPDRFDLLSIDIDGNDYWVWKAFSPRYRPRVVVIEYNVAVPDHLAVTMPYDPDFRWIGQGNSGQSLRAVRNLGRTKGYSLVYAAAPNAFLVETSLLPPNYREVSIRAASGEGVRQGWRTNRKRRLRWHAELKQLSWVSV